MNFGLIKTNVMDNLPHILTGAGIAGVVVTTVMAGKSACKAKEILDEAKETKASIEEVHDNPDAFPDYTEKDYKNDIRGLHVSTALNMVKTFWKPAVTGLLSLGAITTGHISLTQQNIELAKANAGLSATCIAVTEAFAQYRERVREKYGSDADYDLLYGVEEVEIEELDEKGKKKKTKCHLIKGCTENKSPYIAVFDEFAKAYRGDKVLDEMFLRAEENYANDVLWANADDTLFLNQVRERLGLPLTQAGQYLGWKKDKEITHKISFDIKPRETIDDDGIKRIVYYLDFNCDGNVLGDLSKEA